MALPGRPLRVLVADDERVITDSLAAILRSHGFEVTSVYSGYSAIETALTLLPDVIICDILMPGVNGVDAILSMSRRLRNTKFVLLSGYAHSVDILKRAQQQQLEFIYLQKPVAPHILVEHVKKLALGATPSSSESSLPQESSSREVPEC